MVFREGKREELISSDGAVIARGSGCGDDGYGLEMGKRGESSVLQASVIHWGSLIE